MQKPWAGRPGDRGRHQTDGLRSLADVRNYLRAHPHPVHDSRRAARRSRVVTWVFGVFAVFALSTALWPQDPGDVAIGAVLGTTSAAVAVAAGIRSHRRSRFVDDVVRVLSTEALVHQFTGEDAAMFLVPGDSPVPLILRRVHEQSLALAVITPLLADLVPDLRSAAHSAELALIALGRRVAAYEINAAKPDGAPNATDQLSALNRSALSAASDAFRQGVAEYESLVRAAAEAATRVDTFTGHPADEIRSAAEQVEFLSIGLGEIALINDRYQLDPGDVRSGTGD